MMETTETTEVKNPDPAKVSLKLEAIVIPVSDVDRAKQFYTKLGWRFDADFAFENGFRIVQFTPPGSGCSVQFGAKVTTAAPGSAQGLYLVVTDIDAAHAALDRAAEPLLAVQGSGAEGEEEDVDPDLDLPHHQHADHQRDPLGYTLIYPQLVHQVGHDHADGAVGHVEDP